jgi:FkbM family methyltransferase
MKEHSKKLENFLELIRKFDEYLKFEIVEIGAHPHGAQQERFHTLLDFFPESKIHAFEIDEEECIKLNKIAKVGLKFYPYALGSKEEKRKLYETNHPMCSSLYEPNEKLLKLFNNLSVAYLKKITEVNTISLDTFVKREKIESIDFIKMDIQGAELDVLKGAEKSLENVLTIVSEVEFLPIYNDQPLFGDVCTFLSSKNIMFHKFLGLSGRSLIPVILENNVNFPTQHIWSDAVFIKNILKIEELNNSQLLKQAIISYLYGSPDLSYFCLINYDKKNKTNLAELFKKI